MLTQFNKIRGKIRHGYVWKIKRKSLNRLEILYPREQCFHDKDLTYHLTYKPMQAYTNSNA